MARLFTVIAPVPGRRRTRAMARLRRPVVWVRGLVAMSFYLRLRSRRGQIQRLRALGAVGMGGAGVDLQLREHLRAEPVLREHALDRLADGLLGLLRQQVGVARRAQAA